MMLYNSGPSISSLSIYLFFNRFLFLLLPPIAFQSVSSVRLCLRPSLYSSILYPLEISTVPLTTDAIYIQMTPKFPSVASAVLLTIRSTFSTTYWYFNKWLHQYLSHNVPPNYTCILKKHLLLLTFASLLRLKIHFHFLFSISNLSLRLVNSLWTYFCVTHLW